MMRLVTSAVPRESRLREIAPRTAQYFQHGHTSGARRQFGKRKTKVMSSCISTGFPFNKVGL